MEACPRQSMGAGRESGAAVSKDVLEEIALGMLGRFWPLAADGKREEPSTYGFIRRDDDGLWLVDLERWPAGSGIQVSAERGPSTLVGILSKATVYLSDQRRWQGTRQSGQRLEVIRVAYETLLTGLDVNTVEANGIVSAEALFPSQMRWASYEIPDWRWRTESEPLGEGSTLDVTRFPQFEHEVCDGFTLKVAAGWSANWELDRMTMPFGLSLTLSASAPTPTVEFVTTLELLQDLISLCWAGRVPCVPGEGLVNRAQERPGRFWSQRLLADQPAGGADLTALPAVHLEDLGGPTAFGKWLALCRDYKRATRGVSEGLYVGASAEVRLLNTATAIVYWVGANKQGEEWARLQQDITDNDVNRLVMHQLPVFEDWVGDGERFSKRLWWEYNSLKHDPTHEIDYRLVSVFGHTARTMLIGSLLDRVAGSRVPSQRLADHFWQLRQVTMELLDEPGRCDVPEHGRRQRRRRTGQ
jgi:hypothetical protein